VYATVLPPIAEPMRLLRSGVDLDRSTEGFDASNTITVFTAVITRAEDNLPPTSRADPGQKCS
jgi:hypothetical protein